MFALKDHRLKQLKRFIYADIFLIGLGLWSLVKAGSRGAFGGLAIGFFFIVLLYCYQKKSVKKFLAGLMVCVSVSGLMSAFMAGGMQRHYDTERLLLLQSSYAMLQDHKLLGVGLNNWAKSYQQKYIMKNAKERDLGVPHNTMLWFFTTTGVIGGAGYLFFILYYTVLLCRKIGLETTRDRWILYAVLLSFLAINIHGMVDVGFTHKGIARLLYLLLGFAIYRSYTKNAFNKQRNIV